MCHSAGLLNTDCQSWFSTVIVLNQFTFYCKKVYTLQACSFLDKLRKSENSFNTTNIYI